MNHRQKTTLGLLISTVSLLLAATPAQAEPNITLTPSNLTIAGTRCLGFDLGCTTVKRHLLLQTNQELTDLRILSLDLERADGATVLPADAIRATVPAGSVPTNQPLTIPVQFDFSQASSGEYSGVLLVIYADGQLTLPVIVRVKDYWLLPLLVLLAGIGLGIGVSAYRTDGMARDEIVVRVSRIRTQMRADPELAQSFEAKITADLVDVETALENKDWAAAQQALGQAQAVWDKWRKGREDWLAQLKYQSSLVQRLEDLKSNARYAQVVRNQLEDSLREIADKDSPQQWRKDLEALEQQIDNYVDGKARLDDLNQLLAELPQEKQLLQKRDLQNLQKDLDNLSPTDDGAFKTWQQNATDKFKAIEQEIAPKVDSTPTLLMPMSTTIPIRTSTTFASPKPELDPGQAAGNRLRWFNGISYILTIGLLAGAGFGEIYVAKPTFGANGWNDYFALLAWGFGAEATRDSITKFVQNWKVPGLQDRDIK